MAVREGDIVLYVHTVDGDATESPNVSPALVTKAFEDTVHLTVFTSNGFFYSKNIPYNSAGTRGTWHWRCE